MEELLKAALEELDKLESGEEFLLRDLFLGYLWNRIERGERLMFGNMFLHHVRTNRTDVEVLPRGTSGQQRYRKK